MSQIFHPSSNTIARVSLILGAVAPLAIILIVSQITRSPYGTQVNVPLQQPVAFSHEHHSNELGIDCRYCHQTVEKSPYANLPATETCMSCHSQIWTNSPLLEPVRDSYRTGVPIKWNQVNKVPEFVYFNHQIHVNRGLNCNICHGPVQKMQMTWKGNAFWMKWCLDCHRNPENYVRETPEALGLYAKIQRGETLSPEERALANGDGAYKRRGAELEHGKELVKKYGIKTAHLADCNICHR